MPEYTLDTPRADRGLVNSLSTFEHAYIEAMLWTMTDDGEPCDHLGLGDLAPETLARMRADCAAFIAATDISGLLDGADLSQAGHDFSLTRNHHGAGFWDRAKDTYPEDPSGQKLTALAHEFGESDLHIGDDGHVYC